MKCNILQIQNVACVIEHKTKATCSKLISESKKGALAFPDKTKGDVFTYTLPDIPDK